MSELSVIMSVYEENEEYLCLAIDSIINQSYKDFEFIIVLDNPKNTKALTILKYYEKKDSRIKLLINESNIGLALSLNKAAKEASGKYLARMDADDISMPERFQKQIAFMKKNPQITVLGINKIEIDEKGEIVARGTLLPTTTHKTAKILKYSNIMVHPGVIIRKVDFDKIGGYRYFPVSQDFDLWLRFVSNGYKIVNINEYLIKYRTSSYNISINRAYLQELFAKYIRNLYKERIYKKNCSDSYSMSEIEKLLDKDKYNREEAKCYQVARLLYLEGKAEVKKRKILKGVFLIMKSCGKHELILEHTWREIMCGILKRFSLI